MISPNVYLAEAGYIKLDGDGRISEWSAYAKSAGASSHVYLKDPLNKALYDEVYASLSEMAEKGIYGFERVYTMEETREKYGLYADFSFVLETDGYTAFSEWLSGPAVKAINFGDYSTGKGKHGHLPDKGPQPVFIAKGPSFKNDVVVENGNILNHAPTIAAIFGIELRDSVGSVVREILR